MRFSTKIILGTSIIIALFFTAGGMVMIHQNYQVAYDATIENGTKQHIMNRYSLESNLRNALENGQSYSTDLVADFAGKIDSYGTDTVCMVVYEKDGDIIFKNISELNETINEYRKGAEGIYRVYEEQGSRYLLITSEIDIGEKQIWLLNQFDITSVFTERDRQIQAFMKLDIVLLSLSVVFVWILAVLLTRNIKKLNGTSTRIAAGDYSQRTSIKSSDEIGELSRSFDVMAQSVEEHVQKLEAEVEAREQFVSDFSHELKTPMTAMMGYSKLLLSDSSDEKLRIKSADYIYRECKRLESLSKTLLKMLGIGGEQLEKRLVYTDWLAESAERVTKSSMQYATLDCQTESIQIETEPTLVVTLLRNLIENADHSCAEQQNGAVTLCGHGIPEGYLFTIRDTGCGIAKEELGRITGAFYMVDKSRSRKAGGSGLGLTISVRICEVLGIQMNIESELGVGTTVTLLLPYT